MGKKKSAKDSYVRGIAIAAVIVPYMQQRQQFNQELEEQVVVDLAPFNDPHILLTDISLSKKS